MKNEKYINRWGLAAALLLAAAVPGMASASTTGCDPNEASTWGPVSWGAGTVVPASAQIAPGTTLGHNVKIGENVTIGACSTIGDNVVIADAAQLGKAVAVRDGTELGSGSRIGDWSRIGPRSVVGSNAVIGRHSQLGKDKVWLSGDVADPSPNVTGPVTVGDNSYLGDGSMVGANASIGQGVKGGAWMHIGVGAAVADHTALCDSARIGDRQQASRNTACD